MARREKHKEADASPRSVTLRGRRWRIKQGRMGRTCVGYAEDPQAAGKTIGLDNQQSARDYLETVIHECLHCCLWDLDETAVTETAEGIAELLWKMGYRRICGPKKA